MRSRCRVAPFLGLVALFIALPARGQRLELIDFGADWRYLEGRAEASTPVEAWREPGFDDSAWPIGAASIGYGDDDDATLLSGMVNSFVTVYARRAFAVPDPAALARLELDIAYDDGFVAYLNGVEVARAQMPAGPVFFDTRATSHEADAPERFDLTAFLPLLVAGQNLLAVEGHNTSIGSTDFSLSPRLIGIGANPVTRGPYLQMQDESSIRVVWRTGQPSIGEVRYGTSALDQVASDATPTTEHAVDLTGLVPATLYRYQLSEGGQSMVAESSFRSGRSASDTRFRLVAFGDSGVATVDQWNVARLIEGLAPDLLVHTGDVIYDAGQPEFYDPRYFDPYRRTVERAVLWPSLGNHDWRTASGQPFVDAFHLPMNGEPSLPEHIYSFRYADTVFIALDSDPRPAAGSAQLLWLEQQLQAAQGCFTIVFFHHPPYNSGTNHGSDLAIRAAVSPILDRYTVDLVLNGHEHSYERSYPIRGEAVVSAAQEPDYVDPGGTIYVVTGGGGAALYVTGSDWWTARNAMAHHVVVLDRDGDTWTLRAIAVDGTPTGSEIDRATLRRTGCAPGAVTIHRSVNKDDLPVSPLLTTTARSWSDPDAPAPDIFYYAVRPATLLHMVRRGAAADLTW